MAVRNLCYLTTKERRLHAKVIDAEGVDDCGLVLGLHLKQAELGEIGLLAKEFGIDCQDGRFKRTLYK